MIHNDKAQAYHEPESSNVYRAYQRRQHGESIDDSTWRNDRVKQSIGYVALVVPASVAIFSEMALPLLFVLFCHRSAPALCARWRAC